MTITGCSEYQMADIAKFFVRHDIFIAERTKAGWTVNRKPASPGIAAHLTVLADRFGYNMTPGSGRICWAVK